MNVRSPSWRGSGLTAALCLGAALAARAATWYVALDGDHSTGGSWANAYTSLLAAANAAADGDTILLKQGHYYSTNVVQITAKSLTIAGGYFGEAPEPGAFTNDPAATVLDACFTNRALILKDCPTGLIERLTFRNGRHTMGAGIYATNSSFTIQDCHLDDHYVPTTGTGGGLYMRNGEVNLLRCKIRNNTVLGTSYGGGIYQLGGTLTVADSWVTGNYVDRDGAALYVAASTSTRVFNTLIANNVANRFAAVYVNGGSVTLANCTVAGNSISGVERGGGGLTVTDSILWNNGTDLVGTVGLSSSCVQNPTASGPGVIHNNPGFTNGYRLPADSPCVDAGSDLAIALGLDAAYTGLDTPDAGVVDLGYHYPTNCVMLDLYVSPLGTDDPAHGTAPGADAYRSLGYALGQARDDTRIHLEAGRYDAAVETFPLNLVFNNLQILGTNASRTVFSAEGVNSPILRATNVVGLLIRGLTLRDGYLTGQVRGGGTALYMSDARLEDCVVSDNAGLVNRNHGAGLYMEGGAVSLLRCKIRNNRIAASTSGGGVFRNHGHLTVSDSVLANNRNDSGTFGSGAALYSGGVGSVQVWNTLVANNSGYFTAIQNAAGDLAIGNATVAHNAASGVRRTGGTVAISNSILWANGTDITGIVSLAFSCVGDTNQFGPGLLYNDPLFAGPYFLSADSPCVDAGGDTAENLGLDAGYARTDAADTGIVDLGYHHPAAYESFDRHVSPFGTDDPAYGTGPGADAYRSITYALTQVSDHTRLFLEPGLYDESVESFPLVIEARDGLQLLGAGPDLTVLNATNLTAAVLLITNALDTAVSNLTITGGNSLTDGAGMALHMARVRVTDTDIRHNRIVNRNLAGGGGLHQYGGHVDLLRCKIRNNTCTGTLQGGGLYARLGNLAIRETVIIDNALPANRVGGGLAASTMGFLLVENTLIVRNDADTRGGGLYTSAGTAVALTNCTIANNRFGGYFCASPGARLWNSIAWGNGIELTGTITVAYSCFGEAYNIADLIGNIREYPKWADEDYFHLQSTLGQYEGGFFEGGDFVGGPDTSPLLDAGDPTGDCSREPRPSRGLEIGAYGNTPSASLTPVVGFMLIVH